MPDISKFKSVSVSMDTHDKLMSLAQNRFEVPVSVQKVIEFLLEKEIKKTAWYEDSNGIFNSDNEYLRLMNKARVLEIPVLDLYDRNQHSMDIERDLLYLLDQELSSCLLYTSPSPRDGLLSRMPSSA